LALCVVSLAIGLSLSGPFSAADASTPTPLIIDTDVYSNADDVGALATAFALQMNGEDQVIAITVNTRTDRPSVATESWECVAAIAQYYNSPDVPIGADMPDNGSALDSPDFLTPCAALASPSAPAPGSAVSVLRRALVGEPNGSVVIAEIGYEENLQALLSSPGDSISPLSGSALVAEKVKMLVVTGGYYPSSPSAENNFAGNPVAAEDVAANWPTKIVYSGYEVGNNVHVGDTLDSVQPARSPVRAAYDAYDPGQPIKSWDLTTVYHAVRPSDTALTESAAGTNVINTSTANNTFTTGSGNEFYLNLADDTGLTSSLKTLLDVVPPEPVPVDGSPPAITGVATEGQTLTEAHGSWSNSPSGYAYQWQRCDGTGSNCQPIAGATGQTYALGASDVGSTIRVVETASNASGSGTPATSGATAALSAPAPVNVSPPSVTSLATAHLAKVLVSSKHGSATFHLTATGGATGFQCALVRQRSGKHGRTQVPKYSGCSATKTYKHLKVGRYVFYVRAVGPAGASAPAIRRFKITRRPQRRTATSNLSGPSLPLMRPGRH
jgi:inosine-uridine nucleoside N-ribohydrolase